MKLQSYELSRQLRKDVALLDFVNDVASILNLGRYQLRIVTTVPDWTGDEGEMLLYFSGDERRIYTYLDGEWRYAGTGSEFSFEGDLIITSTNFLYFGAIATNGTWRIGRSGDDFVAQRREAGSYVTKGSFKP